VWGRTMPSLFAGMPSARMVQRSSLRPSSTPEAGPLSSNMSRFGMVSCDVCYGVGVACCLGCLRVTASGGCTSAWHPSLVFHFHPTDHGRVHVPRAEKQPCTGSQATCPASPGMRTGPSSCSLTVALHVAPPQLSSRPPYTRLPPNHAAFRSPGSL